MTKRVVSPEGRAALSLARKGKQPSPAVLVALEKARAASSPESHAKQGASLSATMKGRERTPAQKEAFDLARSKAHENMLNGVSPEQTPKYGLWSVVGETLRVRDGDLCQLCLNLIDFDLPLRTPMSRSVDHIIPTRAGGTDDLENLWLSHLVCNQKKGARYAGREDGTADVRV